MSYEYQPDWMRSVSCPIRRADAIERAAGVYGGLDSPDDDLSALSTWQLQQMRRAAKERARLPWRDSQIAAENALCATWRALQRRGALQETQK